jgi:hypothetical protein
MDELFVNVDPFMWVISASTRSSPEESMRLASARSFDSIKSQLSCESFSQDRYVSTEEPIEVALGQVTIA